MIVIAIVILISPLPGDREELSRGGRLHGREERLLGRQPQGRRSAELLPRGNPQGNETGCWRKVKQDLHLKLS